MLRLKLYLDEESEDYIKDVIVSPESAEYLETLPTESFQHVLWQQQVQAASMSNPRGMHWHPLMICWCLYLRHKTVITIHNYHTIHVYDAQLPIRSVQHMMLCKHQGAFSCHLREH